MDDSRDPPLKQGEFSESQHKNSPSESHEVLPCSPCSVVNISYPLGLNPQAIGLRVSGFSAGSHLNHSASTFGANPSRNRSIVACANVSFNGAMQSKRTTKQHNFGPRRYDTHSCVRKCFVETGPENQATSIRVFGGFSGFAVPTM